MYAAHATSVSFCLFPEAAGGPGIASGEERVPLTERAYGYWFGRVPGVTLGQRYGLRADGPWQPQQGHRYNPAKLLLDPYAKAISGEIRWGPELFGYNVDGSYGSDLGIRDNRDSAPLMPKGVVVSDAFDWAGDTQVRRSMGDTLIYEVHVRDLTRNLAEIPPPLRGTYAGLGHRATIEHLLSLGVTAVELLPIHAHANEPYLLRQGLTNHWGYNTLGFFAPHAAYAAARSPQAVVDEVKAMVKALHAAGIEVILDVVYNHSAEWGSSDGPNLSLRGLDSHSYYRLDERGHDIDVTGCGNTIDTRHPAACQLALDSLRYWTNEYHIDGFRFDLAVANARGRDDSFDADHPFLMAIRSDPVLSRVKLIAEPWDLGIHGWRTGQFPPLFAEWNDRFRDTARTFWLVDKARDAVGQGGGGVRDLATRLTGSQDLFGRYDRGTWASINFVDAHDGFTLADLTAYNVKHNLANGENNRDGANDNRSWNHGVEGPSTDPHLNATRRRAMRSMLGTLFLAAGVPMLNGGDEFGRSKRGNNNTYCQDNDLNWFDWDFAHWQRDLLETTRHLAKLRARFGILRRRAFFTGTLDESGHQDLAWYDGNGLPLDNRRWEDPHGRTLQALYDGRRFDLESLLVVYHGGAMDAQITLPPGEYDLLWDSAQERPGPPVQLRAEVPGRQLDVVVHAGSMQVYVPVNPA